MNINQPTQFNPGDTAYTNTVLDDIRGERNVNGGRNILQELLFSPWIAEGWQSFKKPFVADYLRELMGIPSPMKDIGSDYYKDLSTDTAKQQELLKQLEYYGQPNPER